MTLGDCVKQLTALIKRQDDSISIPFKNERPWHILFWRLKNEYDCPDRPAFLDEMVFDWDSEFPKCLELSEFLHALHWNASVSANNPHYETIDISDDVARLWEQSYGDLNAASRDFLARASTVAVEEFHPVR